MRSFGVKQVWARMVLTKPSYLSLKVIFPAYYSYATGRSYPIKVWWLYYIYKIMLYN